MTVEDTTLQYLLAGCRTMGVALTTAQQQQFARFDALLEEANARFDLTAVMEPVERIDRHVLDSLTPLRDPALIPPGAHIIDVGTGAGFPGIPLAIARPDCTVTLLDAQQKRVGFLRETVEALGLRAQAIHARAEDAARLPDHRQRYDVAVSRAVAALPVLLELTFPFVRVGGHILAWKGPAVAEELPQSVRAAALLGGKLAEPIPAPVPGRDWQHVLIMGAKVRETARQYPRKAGEPGRKPLGMMS